MDFSRLNTKVPAERGAELHLRHPALKHPLYFGEGADEDGRLIDRRKKPKPITVNVRGTESATVRAQAKRLQKMRLKAGKKDGEVDEDDGIAFVCALVISFNGVEVDGKPMEPTEENKRMFFEQSENLVEQVIDFATENANFFKGGSAA